MVEQKERRAMRDEKLQQKNDRCLLGWDGRGGVPREYVM